MKALTPRGRSSAAESPPQGSQDERDRSTVEVAGSSPASRSVARPSWVRIAIGSLMAQAAEIEVHRVKLTDIARAMKAGGADTSELVDAVHDIDHAWRHVTSARRSLVMTWPAEDE